jgi:hypothetical protein
MAQFLAQSLLAVLLRQACFHCDFLQASLVSDTFPTEQKKRDEDDDRLKFHAQRLESAMAELKLCRTFWGVDDAMYPDKWDALFATVASQGYSVS